MTFNNVWISSKAHLQSFKELLKDKSVAGSSPSDFRPPPDFPSMRLFVYTFPVVMIDVGQLEISDDEFIFTTKPAARFALKRYLNLHHRDIRFNLSKITNIALFHHDAYLVESCNFPFIEINSEDENHAEILLCCGGSGPGVQKIIQKTDELKRYIESKTNGSNQRVDPTMSGG